MIEPSQLRALFQAASAAPPAPDVDLAARARQGRLSFAATITALRNNCSCEPCQLLRQAVDILLADVKQEITPNAPGHNP